LFLGFLYGGLEGLIVAPIGCALLLRNVPLRKAFWPALTGTVAGGLLGSLVGPPLAVITGAIGFLIGLVFARRKKSMTHVDSTTHT
jgi:hypothetical protein